jgi:signal transduction histidine kinase
VPPGERRGAGADDVTRAAGAGASRGVLAGAALVGLAVCLSAAYALGALASFSFMTSPGTAVPFFPAAGLTLATLVLSPRRTWPLWVVAFGAAEFGVDVVHHIGVALALGYAVANTVEPVVGAVLLKRSMPRTDRFGFRARLTRFVVFAVVVGPLVGGALGATASLLSPTPGAAWWSVGTTWWLGDALGVLVVGSLILAWSRQSPFEDRATITQILAMAFASAAIIVATAVIWRAPVVYTALPVLVWAAFIGGSRAVTTVGAAIAGAVDWAAITGRARHLLASSPAHQLAWLQVLLACTMLTGLILAVEIAERRIGEYYTRRADAALLANEQALIKAAVAERHSITQDTHDIVGHGLNVMLLQLGAARQVLERDPALAKELLGSIEAIGRGACQDLDVVLAMFGHEPELQPAHGLHDVPALIRAVGAAGLRVELAIEGERGEVSPVVEWSAYRIIQEALTNAARHAPGAAVTVGVRYAPRGLSLSVVDDGGCAGSGAPPREGRGIIGMRERAAALGGSLDAGPNAMGGFTVVAELPRLRIGELPH